MAFSYCPLYSGSSGNAALLGTPNTRVLVDAGLTGKALDQALSNISIDPATLQGILITHEHSDHVRGAGVLSRKYDLPVYANVLTWRAMMKQLGRIDKRNMRVFDTNRDFYIGDCNILPYAIPHDAADPVGFCFSHGGRKIAQMTDLGCVNDSILEAVTGADLLLIESNHDEAKLKCGPYPAYLKRRILSRHGHLSNADAGKTCVRLAQSGIRRFILGHLSGENNTERLAYETVTQSLAEKGLHLSRDVELFMAHRDRACGIFRL